MQETYITDYLQTRVGKIPRVDTHWNWNDYLGAIKVRWSIQRNAYKVNPGLYAIGNPNADSEVLVTTNYKLSFDHVRKNLHALNVWILVLNTQGINVWCAAGKGTFSTEELIFRIKATSLDSLINHRRLIVPQLGAVGISAHRVKNETSNTQEKIIQRTNANISSGIISLSNVSPQNKSGYSVKYGPVRAEDLKEYLSSGLKKTTAMRRVNFTFMDRLKLIPVELVISIKYMLFTLLIILLTSINKTGIDISESIRSVIILSLGYLSGTAITPLLLPWIPFRSFALKGFLIGVLISVGLLYFIFSLDNIYLILAWLLINTAISSFLAMNFTGASTYTSLSGVTKEMKIAIPLQIAGMIIGIGIMIIQKFVK